MLFILMQFFGMNQKLENSMSVIINKCIKSTFSTLVDCRHAYN